MIFPSLLLLLLLNSKMSNVYLNDVQYSTAQATALIIHIHMYLLSMCACVVGGRL